VEQVLQLPGRQREVDGGGLRYAPPRRRRAIHYAWLRAAGTVATPPTAPPGRRRLRSWYANPRAARTMGRGRPPDRAPGAGHAARTLGPALEPQLAPRLERHHRHRVGQVQAAVVRAHRQ